MSTHPNAMLRRLHSYPSGSDTDTSPPTQIQQRSGPNAPGKPPVPERNAELLSKVGNKRIPPPPPPRTSSRSPLASPTSPAAPTIIRSTLPALGELSTANVDLQNYGNNGVAPPPHSSLLDSGNGGNSSGSESTHSQDHGQRQQALESRHQELLKKQKQLQEQYARLQKISKNSSLPATTDMLQLKKTGSESNLPQKMGLNMSVSGSMKNINVEVNKAAEALRNDKNAAHHQQLQDAEANHKAPVVTTTTKQVYETDIL